MNKKGRMLLIVGICLAAAAVSILLICTRTGAQTLPEVVFPGADPEPTEGGEPRQGPETKIDGPEQEGTILPVGTEEPEQTDAAGTPQGGTQPEEGQAGGDTEATFDEPVKATATPKPQPTKAPKADPTAAPTTAPTAAPTNAPTAAPTTAPTATPRPEDAEWSPFV